MPLDIQQKELPRILSGQTSVLERGRKAVVLGRLFAKALPSPWSRDTLLLETALLEIILRRFENRPDDIGEHDSSELRMAIESVSRQITANGAC